MLLHDFLKCFGYDFFYVVIWIEGENDDEPSWKGWSLEIPWTYADMRLAQTDPDDPDFSPVSFRENLGEECGNRPGLVITVAE